MERKDTGTIIALVALWAGLFGLLFYAIRYHADPAIVIAVTPVLISAIVARRQGAKIEKQTNGDMQVRFTKIETSVEKLTDEFGNHLKYVEKELGDIKNESHLIKHSVADSKLSEKIWIRVREREVSGEPVQSVAIKGNVLVVDDDEPTRKAMRALLNQEGWQVDIAADLRTAEKLLSPAPDYAILDLMLPDGEGSQIIRDVRRLNLKTKCIVLSASSDEERLQRARDLKPFALLTKSGDLQQILALLK